MRNLIALLARHHRWLLFIGIWALAIAWMSSTYSHHRTALAQWSMRISGSWLDFVGQFKSYDELSDSNDMLVHENALLRSELESLKEQGTNRWEAKTARVLRSPGWNGSPWMVLDRGRTDGVFVGAPILSNGHAAGKIVQVTEHEALVLTLTHPNTEWSVRMGPQGKAARLLPLSGESEIVSVEVAYTETIDVGDVVVTTGFDNVFNADIPVGKVIDVQEGAGDEFQIAIVELGANYLKARHVMWLHNNRRLRMDSLNLQMNQEP